MLPLEPDSLKFAEQVGFKHVETLKQLMGRKLLPGVSGGNHVVDYGGGKSKFEPVFVFQKVASSIKPRTNFQYIQDTPVEEHQGYYVKREDLACLPPGPPFAKVRGLYKHLQAVKDRGVKVVGYYDTSISMATYGICYFSQIIGLKPVVYHYRYADGLKHNQELQLKVWEKYGAEVHVIESANMQKIQASRARNRFNEMYPDGVFLEPGLKFDETLDEVEKQVLTLPEHDLGGTIVICTGSGTMCAGVLRGLQKRGVSQQVIGVLAHDKSKDNMKKSILDRSGGWKGDLEIIDYGYEYTQAEFCKAPFPSCPYYDRKAYKFMIDSLDKLQKPVLFWNIGGDYRIRV